MGGRQRLPSVVDEATPVVPFDAREPARKRERHFVLSVDDHSASPVDETALMVDLHHRQSVREAPGVVHIQTESLPAAIVDEVGLAALSDGCESFGKVTGILELGCYHHSPRSVDVSPLRGNSHRSQSLAKIPRAFKPLIKNVLPRPANETPPAVELHSSDWLPKGGRLRK